MLEKLSGVSIALILSIGLYSPKILAHGTNITYQTTDAISVKAKYDTGKPMGNAQVVIYAPDNPSQPWQQGETDSDGNFTFVPNYQITGNWTIKVRSAGHGDIINIPIQSNASNTIISSTSPTPSMATTPPEEKINQSSITGGLSMAQKLMMAITGSWGFVGTALFFSRKKV